MKAIFIVIVMSLLFDSVIAQRFFDIGSTDTMKRSGIYLDTLSDPNETVGYMLDTTDGVKRYDIWIDKNDSINKHVFIQIDSSGHLIYMHIYDSRFTFYKFKFQDSPFKPIEYDRYFGDD